MMREVNTQEQGQHKGRDKKMNTKEAQDLLEAFISDKDLKNLEQMFGKFNIFDCLKLTRTEIRHSNFLAWLLDPNETHGLMDYFLKAFLKNILRSNKKEITDISEKELELKSSESSNAMIKRTYSVPSIFDIDYWDMTETEVFRELKNIDLLLVDEKNKFVLVIENKIDSSQHSNQLARYRDYVDEQYPNENYKKIFVYLKPQKEDVEKPYIYLNYEVVRNTIIEMLGDKKDKMSNEILVAINHYLEILERDIMNSEDKISKICRQIYRKHRTAIDLINKNSDLRGEIYEILKDIIENDTKFSLEPSNISWIRLLPNAAILQSLRFAQRDWVDSDNMLVIEINNTKNSVSMDIVIRRADENNKDKECLLLDIAKEKFNYNKVNKKDCYQHVKSVFLISPEDYNEITIKDYNDLRVHLQNAISESCLINEVVDLAKEFDARIKQQVSI